MSRAATAASTQGVRRRALLELPSITRERTRPQYPQTGQDHAYSRRGVGGPAGAGQGGEFAAQRTFSRTGGESAHEEAEQAGSGSLSADRHSRSGPHFPELVGQLTAAAGIGQG